MKQETADAITAELSRCGWAKGLGQTPDGKICAGNAIYQAMGVTSPAWVVATGSKQDKAQRLCNEVASKARELFPTRTSLLGGVASFNDHKDTTLEDVLLVIKHCVEE